MEFQIGGRPIDDLKRDELRAALKELNLPATGNKKKLVGRLRDHLKSAAEAKGKEEEDSSVKMDENEDGPNGNVPIQQPRIDKSGDEQQSTNGNKQCLSPSPMLSSVGRRNSFLELSNRMKRSFSFAIGRWVGSSSPNSNSSSQSEQAVMRPNKGRRGAAALFAQNNQPSNYEHVLKKKDHTESFIYEGAETFGQLVAMSTVIVDRTLFLEELMDEKRRAMLLCLPSGVGKTMVMSMCEVFLKRPPARAASEKSASSSSSSTAPTMARLSNSSSGLFSRKFEQNRQFKIMANEDFVRTHFRRYPLLHMDLSRVGCDVPMESIEDQIGQQISKLFAENDHLIAFIEQHKGKSLGLKDEIEANFLHFRRGPLKSKDWIPAIEMLTGLLYECHTEESIILVDNYDSPILNERQRFDDSENWRKATGLIRMFVLALEKAIHLRLLLIFGNYRFQMGSQSKLFHYGVDDDQNGKKPAPLLCYFGFRVEEFNELCDSYRLFDKQIRAEAADYYNGNCVNNTSLFNTSSVMMFLNHWANREYAKFDVYFRQHVFLDHFSTLYSSVEVKRKILRMINTELVTIDETTLRQPFTDDDIGQLLKWAKKLFFDPKTPISNGVDDLFLRLLLNTGFLCRRGNCLQIINKELLYQMKICISRHYFLPTFGLNPADIDGLTKTLQKILYDTGSVDKESAIAKLTEAFRQMLNKIIERKGPPSSSTIGWNEQLVHVFTAVAMFQMRGWSYFASDLELETSRKRPDLIVCSERKRAAMCIELKFGDTDGISQSAAKRTAQFALYQICDRHYLSQSRIAEMAALDRLFAIGVNARIEENDGGKEAKMLVDVDMEFLENDKPQNAIAACRRLETIIWQKYFNTFTSKRGGGNDGARVGRRRSKSLNI